MIPFQYGAGLTAQIVSALLSAASILKNGSASVVSRALLDAYTALKGALKKKFGSATSATNALDLATEKPDSHARKALLLEECEVFNLETDRELMDLRSHLAAHLPATIDQAFLSVAVRCDQNSVQVAGRDLIQTRKLIRPNRITPDDRHLSADQQMRVRQILHEIAGRVRPFERKTKLAVLHRLLQQRFSVVSYLLIPAERFDEAMTFLRQHRAAGRDALRTRDIGSYRKDLYRAIFAGARTLSWENREVYAFAADRLKLPEVASLKNLSAEHLNRLRILVQREIGTAWIMAARSDKSPAT